MGVGADGPLATAMHGGHHACFIAACPWPPPYMWATMRAAASQAGKIPRSHAVGPAGMGEWASMGEWAEQRRHQV